MFSIQDIIFLPQNHSIFEAKLDTNLGQRKDSHTANFRHIT